MSKVYLVGAGPGDPELITLKGRRLLEGADCVLYDNLANTALLHFAPPTAERIYVGKKKTDHSMAQEEICALLIERGRRGWNVVRLKGGDPYLFGRGGEEAEALFDAGLEFEVVPGITSPLGIAAYAGVPLTHRDHTSVVTFITGHDPAKIDWQKVGTAETLVIFMGLSSFDQIAEEIIRSGRSPGTPAIAVRWGTRPDQQIVAGTLATLPALVHGSGLKPPATFIVGEVAGLRHKLKWFERLPLFGQSVVITRAREQAEELARPLRELGARVVELPTIQIGPPSNFEALDAAIEQLPGYDWLIFTSVNGVQRFMERLDGSARDLRSIRAQMCAIGPATRDAIEQLHLKVDVTGEEYVAEGLLAALAPYEMAGKRVLLPRAAVARDVLPAALRGRGAVVDVVEVYRTGVPESLDRAAAAVLAGNPDWITFTSSSTVQNLVDAIGPGALQSVKTVSIGPITSASLERNAIPVHVEASEYTIPGLVSALRASSGK